MADSDEPRFIFVTGGVMSGLGKGITAASTGRLLKNHGLDVTAVKIDPYLNVDAGTMNPYEHGEVYVLKDGGEVDLDLGNYERFLDIDMTSEHTITAGSVYQSVIQRERAGEYLGKTVQIIPHVTDEIKRRIINCAEGQDVCIIELGGTVGDIEGMAFLEAVRQMYTEIDPDRIQLIHVSLIPLTNNGEQKTKPTQHSVKALREIGLHPDIVVGRSENKLEESTQEKISLFCDVPTEAVVSAPDLADVYHVPLVLEEEGLDEYVMDSLDLESEGWDTTWRDIVSREAEADVDLALVGKYNFEDAYLSVHEALKHAGLHTGIDVNVHWVNSDELKPEESHDLQDVDGIIVPGGFGERGTGGKIFAVRYARENDIPYLGLCYGFQMAVIEYARNIVDLDGAHSTEIKSDTPHPVIDLLPDQGEDVEAGGTMRLGDQETELQSDTLAHQLYESELITERHRHRYEVNPRYVKLLEHNGLVFSGRSGNRMEVVEIPEHPFFLGTQFHPELKSRPTRPSPPFLGLVEAMRDYAEGNIDQESTDRENMPSDG
ncbi:MAG: CTP synthase [bacterium]